MIESTRNTTPARHTTRVHTSKRDGAETFGGYVALDTEQYFCIANSHQMPDFFMSLVGASDHWMFVSSNGALTAGRKNTDFALFPYAADDQISSARNETGSTTLMRVGGGQSTTFWHPFVADVTKGVRRNLYKNPLGTKLVFEEINEDLQLLFRYRWTFSERFGFVRSCRLENFGPKTREIALVDGLQNVLPYGLAAEFTMRYSNLGNAYKKNELLSDSGIGLFYLSSIPTDRAEPSEGLMATTVWQTGLSPQATLLSSEQLPLFQSGEALDTESDVRGSAGAYLLNQSFHLAAGESKQWHIAAEVAQDHSDVVSLDRWLQTTADPSIELTEDISESEQNFLRIVSYSDGMQCGAKPRRTNRHLSNTIFNVMRGGVPLEGYGIYTDDFAQHVANFNCGALKEAASFLKELPTQLSAAELQSRTLELEDCHLHRLAGEYLPLAFSRRHGDPTRPWNRFSIDLRGEDGRTNLNYQGNWRDIFQNWEALAISFPEFLTSMIRRFVNSTTADGYNPYRLTKDGFEWEEPEPDDPWSNIGYWGDHQIIYLLKLLEWSHSFHPQRLADSLNAPEFVHANVPYRIKSYADIKNDARATIDFDKELSASIAERVARIGADGKLLQNQSGEIHYVTLLEKMLTLSLAKLSNFVPDGGIWLNTQRPEWNDANNALVGNGLSMVTTCYLHRWFRFLGAWLSSSTSESFTVSTEVGALLERIDEVLSANRTARDQQLSLQERRDIVDALSQAGSDYRESLYTTGPSGRSVEISRERCVAFFETARAHLESTIRSNRRADGLYHSYNLLDLRNDGIEVEHLYEMLEGQVAVLSSGLLTGDETIELLNALRSSSLYRENQRSYILYPDRQLPRFMDKNSIGEESVASCALLRELLESGETNIVQRDELGGVHFNGAFRNSNDLRTALERVGEPLREAVADGADELVAIFDELFDHRRFTGRSGTFFAYEGLGSIYWHMVSKLGLAVSEIYFESLANGASSETIEALQSHLEAIREGIGAEKTPVEYGAFPCDPYSHTPENAGVKQPGMTGQVKEDVLARFAEIGVHIENGCIRFRLDLFDPGELLSEPGELQFYDLSGDFRTVKVPQYGFGFTFCQVPVVYQSSSSESIVVHFSDGKSQVWLDREIDSETSQKIFARTGEIQMIECHFASLRNHVS